MNGMGALRLAALSEEVAAATERPWDLVPCSVFLGHFPFSALKFRRETPLPV